MQGGAPGAPRECDRSPRTGSDRGSSQMAEEESCSTLGVSVKLFPSGPQFPHL